ncbi:hypothetical protein LFREDSHE_29260 [Shewanella baltica]
MHSDFFVYQYLMITLFSRLISRTIKVVINPSKQNDGHGRVKAWDIGTVSVENGGLIFGQMHFLLELMQYSD